LAFFPNYARKRSSINGNIKPFEMEVGSWCRWMRSHPRAQVVQRWTLSVALLAFALRLSIE
jgi:hypothetical protein